MVKKSPLSEATERALLQHLSSPNRYNKFAQVCKSHPLLRSEDPKLRKAISNRKSYLETLSGPQFVKLCNDQKVSTSTQQTFDSEREDYEEEEEGDEDSSDSEESDLRSRQEVQRPPQVQRSPQIEHNHDDNGYTLGGFQGDIEAGFLCWYASSYTRASRDL